MKVRILVVDDEESVRLLLGEILDSNGYSCTLAADATEACEILKQDQFELAIVDICMPGKSGLDLMSHIRTDYPETAVIILSVTGDKQIVDIALEKGAFEYVAKPFRPNEILIHVANTLHRRNLEIENRIHREKLEALVADRTKALEKTIQRLQEAQVALEESEQRYRAFFKASKDVVFISSKDGLGVEVNEAGMELFGYSGSELRSKNAFDFYKDPSDRDRFAALLNKKGHVRGYKLDLKKKDGSIVSALVTATVMRNLEGKIVGYQGIIRDVTEVKRTEQRLRESEEKFRTLAEESPNMIFIIKSGRVVYANRKCEEIMGYKRHEFYSPDFDFPTLIAPESLELAKSSYDRHSKGEEVDRSEYTLVTNDGKRIYAQMNTRLIDYEGEKAILGIVTDITERKRAEDALRRQNAYLAALHETTIGLISRLELHDLLTVIIERAGALLGAPHGYIYLLEPGETEMELRVAIGRSRLFLGRRLKRGEVLAGRVWQTGKPLAVTDYSTWPGRHPDKRADAFRAFLGVPLTSGEQFLGVIGLAHTEEAPTFGNEEVELLDQFAKLASIAIDNARLYESLHKELAERKRVEKELRESEQKFKTISASAQNAIIMMDEDENISFWNDAAEGIFGYSREEALGRELHPLLAPGECLPSYRKGRDRFRTTGKGAAVGKTLELTAIRKDGTEFPIELSLSSVKMKEKWHAIGIVRDITERSRAEEQIRASLKEKEVLLREVHHRVKNNLQVISSLLDMYAMRADNEALIDTLQDARAKIYTIGLIHSQLYRSERMDSIDMKGHIRELVDYLSQAYAGDGKQITVHMEAHDVKLPVSHAIPCALALNEAISNAYKHAFEGRQSGTIEISIRRSAEGKVSIRVKDDGGGVPEGIGVYDSDTLGLKLTRNLIQEQLNGEMKITSADGTEVLMEFRPSEKARIYT